MDGHRRRLNQIGVGTTGTVFNLYTRIENWISEHKRKDSQVQRGTGLTSIEDCVEIEKFWISLSATLVAGFFLLTRHVIYRFTHIN